MEFGIELPAYDGASVEAYLNLIAKIAPKQITWRVRRQVAIGVFPSARMAMYHDLDPSSPTFPDNDIISALLTGSNTETSAPFADEYAVDEPEIEKKVPCVVMDADSSQFSTLVDIAMGKNLAVEGPPGTGKSQTIVNAIAAALADNKKVLFVAEKLAALNVVRSRLEAIGLGEFLLPLQAERSTREQVVASVRDRVEMGKPSAIRDYDVQLAEYRRTRSELAEYIDLLKRPFRNSNLTIHAILGKSIATNSQLDGVPVGVLEQCDIPSGYLNSVGLARLRVAASTIQKAFSATLEVSDSWKTTQLIHADRFTVEEACAAALKASKAFQLLSETRADLPKFGVRAQFNENELQEILQILERFQSLPNSLTLNLLRSLLRGENAESASAFLRECQACQSISENLAGVLCYIQEAALESLKKIQIICTNLEFERLDLVELEKICREKNEALNATRVLVDRLRPLVHVRPEAADWKLSDITKARQAIIDAGREALVCRNASATDPSSVQILSRLCNEGFELRAEKARLEVNVSLAVDVPLDVLIRSASTLRSAGMFGFISANYRRARRVARSLLLSGRYHRKHAFRLLEELINFRKREREFLQDANATVMFGQHYRGLNTEFQLFERLAGFLEASYTDFPQPDQRRVRSFLQTAEFEELELLPELPLATLAPCFSELRMDAVARQRNLEEIEHGVSALKPCLTVFRDPAAITSQEIGNLLLRMKKFFSLRDSLTASIEIADLLAERFNGWQTEVEELDAATQWAIAARPHAEEVSRVLQLAEVEAALSQIRRVIDASERATRTLAELCKKAKIDPNHFLSERSDDGISKTLELASRDPEGLYIHAALATATSDLRPTGGMPLVNYHLEVEGSLDGLEDQFEALAVRKLAKALYAEHGAKLSKFPGSRLNALRSMLAKQDKAIIRLSRTQLRFKVHASAKPPYGSGIGRKSTWTEMALIGNEISKQQRFISVRDLTQRAGSALLELKPCWMMSPLAVTQYVPQGSLEFDLCIIDEASQMPPEAAIGALMRCKQAVVVGDTNQLPPSNFFKKLIEDEEADEDDTVLNESILEMANATFRPSRRLRWHYRSRHSGLIKFSNRIVYGDDLIVFPSANESMKRMGVEFRTVKGLYKAGTNPTEARVIVEAALEFMRTDSERSLGIVTLNQKQRDLISEEFEYALSRDRRAQEYIETWKIRNDGLEEFFIKNLENVQGDERDVMFIGTVYGPETNGGRVAQRFGPINGLAGKRRLNVLFSRAKEKIVTFSSMTAADVVAEENGNAGAHMLKRWLEYCATGTLEGGLATNREPDSDFEIFVANQIKAIGCEPVCQVGVAGYFIDIGVRHPDWVHGFVLGVECDGASYHSAKSARDRDRLRQEVLEELGWRLHRIWSTDWFNNPKREAERLRTVIASRLEELKTREAEFSREMIHPQPTAVPPLDDSQISVAAVSDGVGSAQRRTTATGMHKNDRGVSAGDTVRVRYLSGDQRILQVKISDDRSDPNQGVIYSETPLAKALIGAEVGDEVEVLVGSYVRPAVVESIVKPDS
ncbi:MAG: GreA/GreB family elongation factor [Proteobacteria bacterium]|nr:GreA/GreB family elongation factor [Pseudomonadota bacterium]